MEALKKIGERARPGRGGGRPRPPPRAAQREPGQFLPVSAPAGGPGFAVKCYRIIAFSAFAFEVASAPSPVHIRPRMSRRLFQPCANQEFNHLAGRLTADLHRPDAVAKSPEQTTAQRVVKFGVGDEVTSLKYPSAPGRVAPKNVRNLQSSV